MARRIKLSVKARGESDSPTVEDLLEQITDYIEILKGVEQAMAEDGTEALQWRVVSAATNSPIAIEFEAFPLHYAVDVSRRTELVVQRTAQGLHQLRTGRERPPFFSDKILAKAERLFERVTNGLDRTLIDFGPDLPPLDLTPMVAREAASNTRAVLTPPEKPYEELGSVEGIATGFDRDPRGRLVLYIHYRLTGENVKCIISGEAAEVLGEHQIRDLWRDQRVQVYGTLHFKGRGKLTQVDGFKLRFLRNRSELPDLEDISDEDFTRGMRSEDYLTRLRDGDLN